MARMYPFTQLNYLSNIRTDLFDKSLDITVYDDSTLELKLVPIIEQTINQIGSRTIYLPDSSKSIRFSYQYNAKVVQCLFIDCVDSPYTSTDYEISLKGSTADANIVLSSIPHECIGRVDLASFMTPLNYSSVLVRFKNGIKFINNVRLFIKPIVMSGISTESPHDYYDKGIGLELSIMINNDTIKASKYVLGLHSPVFKAMFENDWKDSRENFIEITDIEYDVMLLFVKALHGVPVYLDDINVAFQFIIVANKYQVDEMKQKAQNYVREEINKDNVISILTLAHKINNEDMKREALNFMTSAKYGEVEELQGYDRMPSDIALLILRATRNQLPYVNCKMSN